MPDSQQAKALAGNVPSPPSERHAWLLACTIGAVGVGIFLAVLLGFLGRAAPVTPPPVLILAPTPVASRASASSALGALLSTSHARGGAPAEREHGNAPAGSGAEATLARPQEAIAARWMEGFYPIYEVAQRTFGVNWLLIASIHMQETAFSTARGTYRGLNFAHCCGGPMQFNVRNGPLTTWDLVSSSYLYGRRPASYDHRSAAHPSIYDDFDAVMAAAHLLSADGAEIALDGSAWVAAYDYYGHGIAGVEYADEVLARAIAWSQRGFCVNCGVPASMVAAVYAAYGAPVLAQIEAPAQVAAQRVRLRRPAR